MWSNAASTNQQFRRVVTRYEKAARNFLAIITVSAIVLWSDDCQQDLARQYSSGSRLAQMPMSPRSRLPRAPPSQPRWRRLSGLCFWASGMEATRAPACHSRLIVRNAVVRQRMPVAVKRLPPAD
jgi:hypothetical protein